VSYLMYYDKLEKSAVFLTRFLQEQDDRTRTFLLKEPISDGGTWTMFVHLVEKYGVVHEEAYPDTYQAKHTGYMNNIVNHYLRRAAFSVTKENLEEHITKIHNILFSCLSTPPNKIVLHKDKHGITFTGSPQQLYSTLTFSFTSHVSFMHAPNKEYMSFYNYSTNDYRNLKQHMFHNCKLKYITRMCLKSLQNNHPVWFSANVSGGADFDRKLMEENAVDYDGLFNIRLSLSKKDLLNFRSISPNHAMVFTGVHCDENGKPIRWKVLNSWGKDKGVLTMSNAWFTANVFEVVIPALYAKDLKYTRVEQLAPWDVLSTVAVRRTQTQLFTRRELCM
jgi:bleomycin hydrolase